VANNHFAQKIASDELLDTIFFSSAKRASKTHQKDSVVLTMDDLKVSITTFRHIVVGNTRCKSVYEAKTTIMSMFA